MNGWNRLYIFTSIIYTLLIMCFVFVRFNPILFNYESLDHLYDQWYTTIYAYAQKNATPFNSESYNKFQSSNNILDKMQLIKVSEDQIINFTLSRPAKRLSGDKWIDPDEPQITAGKIQEDLNKINNLFYNRIEMINNTNYFIQNQLHLVLTIWLIPLLAIYLLSYGIAWVRKGFKNTRHINKA